MNQNIEHLGTVVPYTTGTLLENGVTTQADPAELLIKQSLERLTATLEGYGNTISQGHSRALKGIVTTYTNIALGHDSGRKAWPLAPGLGKTTSIVAWLATACEQEYFSVYSNPQAEDIHGAFSVAISANKIEALCELKRDLIKAGVPEALIGLKHSYKYDERAAGAYLEEGSSADLDDGYASEPCSAGGETSSSWRSKPILLCSHNLIKARTDSLESFYMFKGKPRSLLIWDESLLKADAEGVSMMSLMESRGNLRTDYEDKGKREVKPALDCLELAMSLIDEVGRQQQIDGRLRQIDLSPYMARAEHIVESLPDDRSRFDGVKKLLRLSEEALLCADVYGQDVHGLINYKTVVPRELENIVILDASHPIRRLAAADDTITNMAGAGSGKGLISYEKVTVHQLQYWSGRTTMDKVAGGGMNTKEGRLIKDLVEVVKAIPEDEGVLFFTFKPRWSSQHRKVVDFKRTLVMAMHRAGIDTNATVLGADGIERDRFAWLTHGNETSTSKYAYCKNVVFCGVLHRSPLDITANTYGQTEADTVLDKNLLKSIERGEIGYCFHQGLCRSQCRFVDGQSEIGGINGEGVALAKAANIWIIHKDDKNHPLEELLRKVLPRVNWVNWEPKYLKLESKVNGLAKKIVDWLNNQDQAKISTKKVKMGMDLSDSSKKKVFTRAVGQIHSDPHSGWVLDGRSLVIDDYGFSRR